MTVAELRVSLTERELAEWMAFYSVEQAKRREQEKRAQLQARLRRNRSR
jgi:hypothetical protein